MHRRTALRRTAAVFGAAGLAGCLGGGEPDGREGPRLERYTPVDGGTPTPPAPDFDLVDFEPRESDEGTVAVEGSLELAGEDAEREDAVDAAVVVTVTVRETGEEATGRAPVTLEPGDLATFEVTVEIPYEDYRSGGRVSVDLERR